MEDIERELIQLFDDMNEAELDGLISDITIEADKQPELKGLFNGKGRKAMKKNIKKKTAATIAALVAALGITATAGAAVIFGGADHDKAVHSALGDDIESKDYYIGEQKQADSGHLKLTKETVLFDGENGVLILTIEPTDEIGERIVNSSQFIELIDFQIFDSEGKFRGYGDGTNGYKLSDGCLVEFYAFNTTEYTENEKLTAKGKLNAVLTAEDLMNGEGSDLSNINFEFEKNAEPVTLKNENGVIMHLSDYLIYIEDDDTLREPYNIKSDINITYKDGTTDIIKQSTYVNDTLVLNDFLSSVGKYETKKYGIATVQYILKLIDSKNVKSVSFDGQTFTAVEQS